MSAARTFRFAIGDDHPYVGKRLDRFLAEHNQPELSRSQIKKQIAAGDITVNGEVQKAGHKLRAGDRIQWHYTPRIQPSADAEPIDLALLYEDSHLAVVDKPQDLVVHPARSHPRNTLVNGLVHRFGRRGLSSEAGDLRPGIVHRLDRYTSGSLVIARHNRAHQCLSDQFRDHAVHRVYHALVHGPGLDPQGTFDTPHNRHPNERVRFTGHHGGRRRAITHYRVLERFDCGACLVACRLETGRTHQIRMHFYEAHAPILGDHIYGGRRTGESSIIDRQALHAYQLGFRHPGGFQLEITSPYPDDFSDALADLRRGSDWR